MTGIEELLSFDMTRPDSRKSIVRGGDGSGLMNLFRQLLVRPPIGEVTKEHQFYFHIRRSTALVGGNIIFAEYDVGQFVWNEDHLGECLTRHVEAEGRLAMPGEGGIFVVVDEIYGVGYSTSPKDANCIAMTPQEHEATMRFFGSGEWQYRLQPARGAQPQARATGPPVV